VNADGGQGVAHFLKLERFYNGDNELHVVSFPALSLSASSFCSFPAGKVGRSRLAYRQIGEKLKEFIAAPHSHAA
jgi:hypothetical protein